MAGHLLALLILVISGASVEVHGKLSPKHYKSTCPNVLSIVEKGVAAAVNKEPRMGASLVRLHFHDCFVNGCDGSILLDDNATFTGEKTAPPNNNSVRGFDVIDGIKAELQKACPGAVSCADILAIAARDSTVLLGGPSWKVKLGRRDATNASKDAAKDSIPSPNSNFSSLISKFAKQGLSVTDLVALSGAHTIGLARCTTFRKHIYNDTNIDPSFVKRLKKKCLAKGNDDQHQPLDFRTPTRFDDLYFKNLLMMKGLLRSDQVLLDDPHANKLVHKHAANTSSFFKKFAKSMIKMGNIKPLTGSFGEIRINCRKVN